MKSKNLKSIADFIYEVGILQKTPRSGLWFLGTGSQSVAEHLFRTAIIGYVLSKMTPKSNTDRVIFLCLVHDLGEGRTSDLNYIHQRYGRLAEGEAISDLAKTLPFGKEIKEGYKEEQERKTLEGKIAKDADVLEWIVTLREEGAKGNTKTKDWIKTVEKRLQTKAAKKLVKVLITMHPDHWWFDIKDKWFYGRDPRFRAWKSNMKGSKGKKKK